MRGNIADLFTSKEFCKNLKESAKITSTTNHESGFISLRNIKNKKYYHTDVVEGDCDNIGLIEDDYYECFPQDKFLQYLDLHFHPNDGIPVPSEGDIAGIMVKKDKEKNVIHSPIKSVGTIKSDNIIDLVLFQRKTKNEPSYSAILEISQVFFEKEYDIKYVEEVAEIIQDSKLFNARSITYSLKNKVYRPNKGDLKELDIFKEKLL